MSKQPRQPLTSEPLSAYDDAAKTNAIIAYVLMIVGQFTGIFWLIGVVWAMIKKSDAKDSIFYDHYRNITITFWWGLGFAALGFILTIVIIGYVILALVWLWTIYRVVKGLLKISSNKSYR